MKALWAKIKAIKGWFLILPALGVLGWGVLRLLGRAFFKSREPGPKPLRYVDANQERTERERIEDHNEASHAETDRVADAAEAELDAFLEGGD
jgi:hypothetical protein